MLHLRVFGDAPAMDDVVERLGALPGAEHVTRAQAGDGADRAFVTADLDAQAADGALEALDELGVEPRDVWLLRLEGDPARSRAPGAARGRVGRPHRAGGAVLAAGGALPGLHGRGGGDRRLRRALRQRDPHRRRDGGQPRLPADRGGLHRHRARAQAAGHVRRGDARRRARRSGHDGRPADRGPRPARRAPERLRDRRERALGADDRQQLDRRRRLRGGIAGILALETRASAAVGVAISVTTIPASAYLGVAAGVGSFDKASGAAAVLVINVAMLLTGGTVTLLGQRLLSR